MKYLTNIRNTAYNIDSRTGGSSFTASKIDNVSNYHESILSLLIFNFLKGSYEISTSINLRSNKLKMYYNFNLKSIG
jgi:hypothetical protein